MKAEDKNLIESRIESENTNEHIIFIGYTSPRPLSMKLL